MLLFLTCSRTFQPFCLFTSTPFHDHSGEAASLRGKNKGSSPTSVPSRSVRGENRDTLRHRMQERRVLKLLHFSIVSFVSQRGTLLRLRLSARSRRRDERVQGQTVPSCSFCSFFTIQQQQVKLPRPFLKEMQSEQK